ncbi:MAG: sugar phosphate nucleotidyltransferase, partial [Planctomycetota bacterium]
MKIAILAGGFGSRLAEETEIRPKPMVEIGGKPILWHIMQHYAHFGFERFVIALGYKGEYIKRYFSDYCSLHGNLTVSLKQGEVRPNETHGQDWTIELVET